MLSDWLNEFLLTGEIDADWQVLAQATTLADPVRAKVFNITPDNVTQVIQERSHLLKSVFPAFSQFCENNLQIPIQAMLQVLWDLWLPLGMKIASQRQKLGRPFIQGILGGQGTGKTTMSRILCLILQELGYSTLSLSLDDLYKTYSDRLTLMQQDPRLIWRGPPGTHDIDLGLSVLDQIRQGNSPVTVPRFDKSAYSGAGDRTTPEIVTNVDIVLFEGWFVGVLPIDPQAFTTAPPPIITDDDRAFACDMNHQLQAYLPLWQRLDSLIALDPSDYRCSLEWRKQAERKMIVAGKSGMNDSQIEEFVNYFWRSLHPELLIKPLLISSKVDLVIQVNTDHSFGAISSYHSDKC
ncbi:glycerate kinase [Sphaerospermopsis sp. LEGE 08334]|jgi:D-glycerate 3-kinase|uniref:glycerate kinase n=1 Tax=Sphaerospermopsis sp. LEGE 08334 TaxID=1828651 RepID=UPI001880D8FE|nr:glycerate kinase [Sphaerospermopsis sp. LEGE 08334]MBE9056636.1 glycerate kinase [Sphaerospermopsis sp. LEGE 08334]